MSCVEKKGGSLIDKSLKGDIARKNIQFGLLESAMQFKFLF